MCLKNIINYLLAFLLIFNFEFKNVNAIENERNLNTSKNIVNNEYADRFCSAKSDHFFEGLEKEKTLKYSYFKYIGINSKELFSDDLYNTLISQIRNTCNITDDEEKEIYDFLKK